MDRQHIQEKLSQELSKLLNEEFFKTIFPRLMLSDETGQPGIVTFHFTEAATNNKYEISISIKVK